MQKLRFTQIPYLSHWAQETIFKFGRSATFGGEDKLSLSFITTPSSFSMSLLLGPLLVRVVTFFFSCYFHFLLFVLKPLVDG